jgi:hypothetical protein
MKLVKRIGNFKGSYPTGECADKQGNVWVASPAKHEMLEYSHDGKLVHTILISHEHLTSYALYGCAVNPVNGALAVVDAFGRRYASGKLLVYSSPSAKPAILRNPDQVDYFAAAYDSSGDLWTTGYGESPMVSACGAKSCRIVTLRGGSIYDPIAIAWDDVNHAFVILDSDCHQTGTTCSYPVSTNGRVGRPTTYLNPMGNSVCLFSEAAIVVIGKTVMLAGSDNQSSCTSYKQSSVDLWAYPTGGLPVQYSTKVVDPWGVAVSSEVKR